MIIGAPGLEVFPVLIEEADHFFCVPVVVLEQVESKIIVFDEDHTLDFGQLGEDILEELLVLHELLLELFHRARLLVQPELAGAAGVGVGVAQVQVRQLAYLAGQVPFHVFCFGIVLGFMSVLALFLHSLNSNY